MTGRLGNGHGLESTIDLTPATFADPGGAVQRIIELYDAATGFLRERFTQYQAEGDLPGPVRACYPYVKVSNATHSRADTRLSYGFVADPGTYADAARSAGPLRARTGLVRAFPGQARRSVGLSTPVSVSSD